MGIFLLILMVLLSGCGPRVSTAMAEEKSYQIAANEAYTVYDKATAAPAPYEGETCLLGAEILRDELVNGDIRTFEALVGDQEIYGYTLAQGEAFPTLWLLECYVQDALPKLTVSQVYNTEELTSFAEAAGRYQIPILMEFMPYPSGSGIKEADYKAYFIQAREVFAQKAPNVAFVWTADCSNGPGDLAYYPGDTVVDWVGASLRLMDENSSYGGLEFLYFTFQEQKPMLVNLGIAHYATQTSKYNLAFAEKTFESAYHRLLSYPRIRAIVYENENQAKKAPLSAVRYDYSITGEKRLLAAYKKAMQTSSQADGYVLSPYSGYVIDKKLYLRENDGKVRINGNPYQVYRGDYTLEEKEKRVFLFSGTFSD